MVSYFYFLHVYTKKGIDMNAQHALIRTLSRELAYITKRFDRLKRNKNHVEDLCQL
mgnify:CR=1 FL=1